MSCQMHFQVMISLAFAFKVMVLHICAATCILKWWFIWAFALKQMILYIFDVHLGGSICLWVSMTTLNSENITLFSDSVTQRGWGSNCLWVSLTTLNSEEITLSSASVDWEGSICLWCLYLYICTGISLYFLISACESQWQHWTFAFKVMILYIFGVKHILM